MLTPSEKENRKLKKLLAAISKDLQEINLELTLIKQHDDIPYMSHQNLKDVMATIDKNQKKIDAATQPEKHD